MKCSKCKRGKLQKTGMVFFTDPHTYELRCDECGEVFDYIEGDISEIRPHELKPLQETKEETIEKWSKLGLLEGLTGNVKDGIGKLFESQLSWIINESGDTVSEFNNVQFPVVKLGSNLTKDEEKS